MVRVVATYGAMLVVFISISSSIATGSTYISLDDRVYAILLRLEAEGVIQSGLLTTRPISQRELTRLIHEAERNSSDTGPLIRQLVGSLRRRFRSEIEDIKFIAPASTVYVKNLHTNTDRERQELYYNNDGDELEKGSNLRFGFFSKVELGWSSFFLNPELISDNVTLKRGYGLLSFLGFDLVVGRDSQWWGPGYHGALLLTNNPMPFGMIKFTNPQPLLLPWIFRYAGPFRLTYFVTRLEQDGIQSERYLWGVRVNIKPAPYIEIGLHRMTISGVGGSWKDLGPWRGLLGAGADDESAPEGSQRTGLDIKVTLPSRWQPWQIYLEAAGEDGQGDPPQDWAYLGGLYLPRLLVFERLDFRAEYAVNTNNGQPNYSEYTYQGKIIGHHAGSDSTDIFFEMNYHIPALNSMVSFSHNIEEHELSDASKHTITETSTIGLRFDIGGNLGIEGEYTFGESTNTGDGKEKINLLRVGLDYNF